MIRLNPGQQKLLFIHVPKTGGKFVREHIVRVYPHYFYHLRGIAVREAYKAPGELFYHQRFSVIRHAIPRNVIPFAIVRNPYTWLESCYFYFEMQSVADSFEQFILDRTLRRTRYTDPLQLCNQSHFAGGIPVENIIKYENMYQGLESFFARNASEIRFERVVVGASKKDEKITWTKAMYEVINEDYEEDFENFNYEMR
jgi:hypothetical protein